MKFRIAMSLLALGATWATGAAHAATFVVDSPSDAVDVAPGDGVCLSAEGTCTLRAAVMETNALDGADLIDLTDFDDPTQPITLSLVGVDESFRSTPQGDAACALELAADASIGDLDVTDDLTVQGAGPGRTVIRWANQDLVVPAVGDRIFHVQSNPGEAVNRVRIADLAVTNGSVGVPADLDADNPYNCAVTGTTGRREAWQFRRYGGAIALGAGAAVVLFEEALHEAVNREPDRLPDGDAAADARRDVARVELSRLAVVGNRSGADGGGIDATVATVIEDSVVSANQASGNGGGLYLGATSTVSGSLIGGSDSDVDFPSGSVPAAWLGANVARDGGGILADGLQSTSIGRSAINLNQARAGGAIAGRTLARLELSDTTVSGNTASVEAGAITASGRVTLRNVTVANNRATSGTAGIGAGLNGFDRGAFLFANTLFSDNVVTKADGTEPRGASCGCTGVATRCPLGVMNSFGNNLNDEASDTCGLIAAQGDLTNVDPLLGTLSANGGRLQSHRLPSEAVGDAATSPAIDAGSNQRCTNNDQRLSIRPEDGDADGEFDCDIGAFELFVPRQDLNIANALAPDRAVSGDTFSLVVDVRNDSPATVAPAVSYAGTVAPTAGLSIVSASATAGACSVVSTSEATCAIGDLAAGAAATVTLDLTAGAQGNYTVESEVANDPAVADPVAGNNTVTSVIAVKGSSDVALAVTADTDTVRIEEQVTFDYLVSNVSGDDAENVRLAVDVPGGVEFFSASYNPAYSCVWAVTLFLCQLDELGAGESTTFRLILVGAETGDYVYRARIVADQADPDLDNNRADNPLSIDEKRSTGGGGGGCAYNPGSPVDPMLPGLLMLALLTLYLRRRRSALRAGAPTGSPVTRRR